MVRGILEGDQLKYLTVLQFCSQKQCFSKDLAEYLFANIRNEHPKNQVEKALIKVISSFLLQKSYHDEKRPVLGQHYTINIALKFKSYKPTKHEELALIRLLSAKFGRDMRDFAASNGIQY
ncbi:hypothetical protein SLS61_008223 [Didymella pomorum]